MDASIFLPEGVLGNETTTFCSRREKFKHKMLFFGYEKYGKIFFVVEGFYEEPAFAWFL